MYFKNNSFKKLSILYLVLKLFMVSSLIIFISCNAPRNNPLDPNNPNYIFSEGPQIKKTSYYDGFGHNIQTQIRCDENDIILAADYDPLHRVEKAWKPYLINNNHLFEPEYAEAESNPHSVKHYYSPSGEGPDAGDYPYSETMYLQDG